MTKMLRITAKRDGYRRCGVAHHGTADHPVKSFDEAQIETLKHDPMLVVQEVEDGTPLPSGVSKKADQILAEAKAKAEEIVADAKAEAEKILADAQAKGGGKK